MVSHPTEERWRRHRLLPRIRRFTHIPTSPWMAPTRPISNPWLGWHGLSPPDIGAASHFSPFASSHPPLTCACAPESWHLHRKGALHNRQRSDAERKSESGPR